jgi:hypothetical protein
VHEHRFPDSVLVDRLFDDGHRVAPGPRDYADRLMRSNVADGYVLESGPDCARSSPPSEQAARPATIAAAMQ